MSSTMASITTVLWTALVFWTVTASSQILPYVPTTILPASENRTNRGLYILSPTDTSVDLLFLNTSSKLEASSLSPRTLTSGLPFLGQSGTSAFTASVADDGTLTVFAGDCSTPGSEAIWTYGQVVSTSSAPTWVKHAAGQSSTTTTTPGAPYFLGGSLSFSSTIAPALSPPVTYVYGGMCPWANSSAATWQSAATYSNRMLKVSAVNSRSGTIYTAESTTSMGQPIAEAGFTFTALTPAISNRSGTVSQEIGHVLLGGHTQKAFINMSTAAVWNLPEETWNIVYINPPAASYGNTELAIKAVAGTVESRSGHTAVLNEDGTALVVFGGWVGDLSEAASPQLAILEMGSSLADWKWSIPELQPTGPGIYGHGAVLLPGNVMMVYGGYATSSATKKQKRATTKQPMFLNLTSLTWSTDYTNPTPPSSTGSSPSNSTSSAPTSTSTSTSGGSSTNSRPSKLPLGLGLGLGIPALLLLVALAIWLRRRQRQKRHRREEIVRGLAQDAGRFLSADDDEMAENEHFGGGSGSNWFPTGGGWSGSTAAQDWYTGGGDPYVRGSRSLGYETLRGGKGNPTSSYPPPLPPVASASASGLNRSRSAARGLYLPTTGINSGGGYEFGPTGGSKAGIHPIYEAEDEDGEVATGAVIPGGRSSSVSPERPSDDGASDPFVTPATTPRGPGPTTAGGVYFPPPSGRSSLTPSPELLQHVVSRPVVVHQQAQDAEVQEWVSDIDAADAVLTARIGPHTTTTTTTTMATTPPKQGGRPPRSRRNSLSFPLDSDEARTGSNLSESARSTFSFAAGGGASRSDSVRLAGEPKRTPSSSGSSSHTYNTAKTHNRAAGGSSFAGLREEGPSLLLGSAARGYSPEHDHGDGDSPPGSPSKHKPSRRSWLGSLRRVFSGSGEGGSSSRGESPTEGGGGGGGSGSDYEPRLVGMGPGGRLLRRKQGKEAWGAERREGEGGREEEDDEWDVERAVEQRLVQIMFTVPKERLRVVNAEVEREEEGEIVDPEKEGWLDVRDEDIEEFGESTRYRRQDYGHGKDEEGVALRREEIQQREEEPEYGGDIEKLALRREESREGHGASETLLEVPEQERRPSTPMTPTTFHTAEAVKLERPSKTKLLDVKESIESLEKPKTKVLQMVESIESLSRGGSPASSPVREK
ncbi:hypothetical protein CONLIGDRAFT_377842 [Coniochaeta ligniaria NRRL 30616]|uniref:Galactose oxidase n=1 Tax=Coniochaeta ligniaria NRRL 30616 TaxID=1408157 RepID=A0A1J7JFI4_9PEZI|nr:hypothetical protein CONLIGDRAFT_377842 [Coniochaeta ligniaria NRRL 30616]